MKYTIIDSAKKKAFIQQAYDSVEEATKRLDGLGVKFAGRLKLEEKDSGCLRLAVVGVDEDGEYHDLTPKAAPASGPSKQGPTANK